MSEQEIIAENSMDLLLTFSNKGMKYELVH